MSPFATALLDHIAKLFSRDTIDPAAFAASLQNGNAWAQWLCVAVLLWATHTISRRLTPRSSDPQKLSRHLIQRLCWPLLLFVATALVIPFYDNPIWLYLLAAAARWMMLIRAVLALFAFLLPNSSLMHRLEYRLSGALWLFFVLWVSGLDNLLRDWLTNLQFRVGTSTINLYTVLSGLFWMGVCLTFAWWLSRTLQNQLRQRTHLDEGLQLMLSKISTTILMILAVLISLPLVGIDLTVLSVFSGALGVGIGFGLQKIASNYISGFIILGERAIRPGDRISVGGITGYISTITARFVVLRSSNGQEALIPNETFIGSTIINESYSTRSLWQSIELQVATDTDLPRALSLLEQAAARQSRIQTAPAPQAFVVSLDGNAIGLKLGFWVADPENGFLSLKSAILLDIWHDFAAAGIKIT